VSRWGWTGLLLVGGGALGGVPGLLLIGAMMTLVAALTTAWSRFGLRAVRFERRLGRDRVAFGEEIPLEVSVWNAKLLPLAWLEVSDLVSDGAVVRELRLARSERPGSSVMRTLWTLGSFEEVVRHFHIVGDHRGAYRLGPARLQVADLFGRESALREDPGDLGYLVLPRTVPVRLATPEVFPLGGHRARQGLHEDPALFAGVRPYQPGDPRTRLHWRATARTGRPVSKRFEPATLRQTMIALDVQTFEGPHWEMTFDEEVLEGLMVAAASLGRHLITAGGACGLAAYGWTAQRSRLAWVPAGTGEGRLAAIVDTLARMSPFASAPFASLLGELPRRLEPATSVLILSSRNPAQHLGAEIALARSGFPVTHVALGEHADEWAAQARDAGMAALVARLPAGWRASEALDLAG